MKYNNLIFDLDDTLIECSAIYNSKKDKFAEFQSNKTGLSKEFCLNLLNKIDVAFTELPDGFDRHRFPRSFASTSATLDIIQGRKPNQFDMDLSYHIADSVFREYYPSYEGVIEFLLRCKNDNYKMFLLTKGDDEIQKNKIKSNRLDEFFKPKQIHIVKNKSADVLQKILKKHKLNPAETIYVGDSLRDDVGPANECNVTSVLVNTNSKWDYENTNFIPTYTINNVIDLSTILGNIRIF